MNKYQEALKRLRTNEYLTSREKHINSEKNKIVNDCVSQIRQDLERLEVLESNSDKVIKDSVKLINKNLELQARLETLEKENKELEEMLSVANYVGCGAEEKVWDLTQENEKLKKVIENEIELLIERRFNAYACDNYEVYNVIDAIIEELKEVLE